LTKKNTQASPGAPANQGRRVAVLVFALAALLFVYHLFADRLTPYSAESYVRAYLVAIAPEVSGLIIDVPIKDNQRVSESE
jgi:multidrug resistance efflux pump